MFIERNISAKSAEDNLGVGDGGVAAYSSLLAGAKPVSWRSMPVARGVPPPVSAATQYVAEVFMR